MTAEAGPRPPSDVAAHPGTPLLAAGGSWKSYGGVHAVRDVSIESPAGSVTALVGDSGAGKSTLIKMLSGVVRPDRGQLEVDGVAVQFENPAAA